MKKLTVLIGFFVLHLFAAPAWATRYWAATTGSAQACANIDGTNDPGAGNYGTIASAVACANTSGDEVYIKPGTYTSSLQIQNPTSGVTIRGSDSTRANWPVLAPTSVDNVLWFTSVRSNVTFQYLKIDMSSDTAASACLRTTGGTEASFITLEDFECTGPGAVTYGTAGVMVNRDSHDITVRRGTIHGWQRPASPHGHGVYANTYNSLFEHLDIYDYSGWGIQIYSSQGQNLHDNVVRYNNFHDGNAGIVVYYSATDNVVYDNIIDTMSTTNSAGIRIQSAQNGVYNNAVYNSSNYGLQCEMTTCPSSVIFANNISLGNSINSSIGGATSTTNRLTGTATDTWNDPANGDFTLKDAVAAIDGGTNMASAFNGNWPGSSYVGDAPDQGPFEAPVKSSGSVESGDTSNARITWSVASKSIRNGTGLQVIGTCGDNTPFTTTDNGAGETETGCTVVGTDRTDVAISGSFTTPPFVGNYTRGASNYVEDSVCLGDPNVTCYNAVAASWPSTLTLTDNTGGTSVVWTTCGYRGLRIYSSTSPSGIDFLKAEDAGITAGNAIPLCAGCYAAAVVGLCASGGNPDSQSFQWYQNNEGGSYSLMTNTCSATDLCFAGTGVAPNMTDLETISSAILDSSSSYVAGSVIAQQASQPNVDLAQNDDTEAIIIVHTDPSAAVGDIFCLQPALTGLTPTSITQTTYPCFEIIKPRASY